jgi:hypothetical protein
MAYILASSSYFIGRRTKPMKFVRAMTVILALGAFGCGSGRGDVSGRVTLEGAPLKWGTVLIEGTDGVAKQGNIDSEGKFTVLDMAPGNAMVAVNSPDPKSITVMSKGDKPAQSFPAVPGWFAIPKEYASIRTSGLAYVIKGGRNTIDIDLKSN